MNWSSMLGLALLVVLLVGLGAALIVEPWLSAIAMVVLAFGSAGVLLLWRYPELGLVLFVFLGAQILHPDTLDLRLPIGGGLETSDLVLLGLAGLFFSKQLLRPGFRLQSTRFLAPFAILFALALFSTLRATLLLGVEVPWSFGELRGIAYLFILLLTTWELRQREQIIRLFIGLFLVALVTVGLMIAQQFVGSIPLVAGQETTGWQIIDIGRGGITRIRPPGHLLLYYLSVVAFAMMAFSPGKGRRTVMLALTLLLNLVLLLTFTRSQWLASILAILTCALFVPRAAKLWLAAITLGVVFVASAIFMSNPSSALQSIQNNPSMGALLPRIQTMVSFEETLDTYAQSTRKFQTQTALDSINRNPALGVGLGNAYRRLTPDEAQSRNPRFARFLENSYLYIATKLGVPALVIFGWLITTIVFVSYKAMKSARDPTMKAIGLASFATLIGLIVWGFTHPVLFLPEHTLVIGLVGGIAESMRRMNR